MEWIAIVLFIVEHIPDLIKIIEIIIDIINNWPKAQRAKVRKQVRMALSNAIKTKDKEHVRVVVRSILKALQTGKMPD